MNHLLRKLLANRGLYLDKEDGSEGEGGGGRIDNDDEGTEEERAAAARQKAIDDATPPKPNGSKISDAEAKLLKENMAKKKALKEAEDALKAAQDRLKEFEGVDPAEMRKLIDAQKDAETKRLEAAGEYDRVKKQMAEEHARSTAALKDQITLQASELQNLSTTLANVTVGASFTGSQFVKDGLVIPAAKVKTLYGGHFEFKDGHVIGYDKPVGAADRTPLVDEHGNFMQFDAALKKIIDADPERDQLLKSKVNPGAGRGSRPPRAPPKPVILEGLTGRDRIAAGLKKG